MACGAGKSALASSPWAEQMKRSSQNTSGLPATSNKNELQSVLEGRRSRDTLSPVLGAGLRCESPGPNVTLKPASVALVQKNLLSTGENSRVGMTKSKSSSSLGETEKDGRFLGVSSMKSKFESPGTSPGVSPVMARKWDRSPGSSPMLSRNERTTKPSHSSPVLPDKPVIRMPEYAGSANSHREQPGMNSRGFTVAPPPPKPKPASSTSDSVFATTGLSQTSESSTPSPVYSPRHSSNSDVVLLPTRMNQSRKPSSSDEDDNNSADEDEYVPPQRSLPGPMITTQVSSPLPDLQSAKRDDSQLLFEMVPAPRPKPKPRARNKPGSTGLGMGAKPARSTPPDLSQDTNNNRKLSGTGLSGLDDGYSELCENESDGSKLHIRRLQRNPSPQMDRKREGHFFSADASTDNQSGRKRDSSRSSNSEEGFADNEVFSPVGTHPVPPPPSSSRRTACKPPPLPTVPIPCSPGPTASFLFSQQAPVSTVDYVQPSVLDGDDCDIPPTSPPPVPHKSRTTPVQKTPELPTAPEELVLSVPPPVLPPRGRNNDDPSTPVISSVDSALKSQRSRLVTLDVEKSNQIKNNLRTMHEMDSIDELGAPPPPPPLPPRVSDAVSLGRKPSDADSACMKGLTPDTRVPLPVSPTQGSGENVRKPLRAVEVPAPDSPKHHTSTGSRDDDVPTSPPPMPPGLIDTLMRKGKIPSNRAQASYIDPNQDLASTPDTLGRKRPPAGHKFATQVSLDPTPNLTVTGNLGEQRPGAHKSYLDLLMDEEEPTMTEESDYYSFMDDEPLYQVYHRDVVAREIVHQSDIAENSAAHTAGENDDYMYMDAESVQTYVTNILSERGSDSDYGLIGDTRRESSLQDVIKLGTGVRKMWSEMPEVKKSGCMEQLTSEERKLQEALFEVITSEASYVKSLNLLHSHFLTNEMFNADSVQFSIISKQDHHVLFSNVDKVRQVSQSFLQRLEALWHESCVLAVDKLAQTMANFARKYFDVYVVYVKNQMFQERTLKHLRETSSEFVKGLARLENDPSAQGLTLQSFLVLPMQRVTRLPLLVDSICHRLNNRHPSYEGLTCCLTTLQKIVRQCNEGARQMSNIEQVNDISRVLEFKKDVKTIPIVSQHRSLVKKGQVTRVLQNSSGLFARKKEAVHLFLFNDLLLITKKKGRDQYQVIEHTPRIHIHADILSAEAMYKVLPQGAPSGCNHLFSMVLLENDVKFYMAADSMSERMRWVEAVTPPQHLSEDERIYEDWDCPQVQCIERYVAEQPDELSLEESDVINVSRKVSDGWYEGERIRDGEKGWFPSSVTVEIQSAHLRAKNLRQHYRMLLGMVKESDQ